MQNHKEMNLRVAMHAGPAQCTYFYGLQEPNFVKLHGFHDLEHRIGTLLELIGQRLEQNWNTA